MAFEEAMVVTMDWGPAFSQQRFVQHYFAAGMLLAAAPHERFENPVAHHYSVAVAVVVARLLDLEPETEIVVVVFGALAPPPAAAASACNYCIDQPSS